MKAFLKQGGLLVLAALVVADAGGAGAADAPPPAPPRELPALPSNLPGWLDSKRSDRVFHKRGSFNFAVYGLKPLARDLNAVTVGHAMAYEDLVTGKASTLETRTFDRIDWILKNPPDLMPDEAAISPTFGRLYGVLEQVFDWTHVLHAQTVDVLASKKLPEAEKDRKIEGLWKYYFESVPYAITPLPMNMAFLDGQPYSGAFRKRYPKVNGLFWGYHWLQGVMYDALYRVPAIDQAASYALIGERYHTAELHRTDRPFMPMFAETSPRFAARFPQIANAFDNLHMLHDMVNDILASEWMTKRQKEQQIKRAIWLVSAAAHRDEARGDRREARGDRREARGERREGRGEGQEGQEGGMHDHRFFEGMPGMGLMKGMPPALMWMEGQGWMSMADCHHCTMPLWSGKDEWRNPTVSAEGWTMRVRCALCARDMSAETKGKAILRIPTEDPYRLLVVYADDQGMKGNMPGAVFLEKEGSHAGCDDWSRAFTGRAAFDAFVKQHPEYLGAKPLSFEEWAQRQGEKPDTYVKPDGPSENPYEEGR
jgi:hypothetical protein